MTRRPDTWSRAMDLRDAPGRPVVAETRHVAVIDGRGAVSTRAVSLASIAMLAGVSIDDVDPRGVWPAPQRHGDQYIVTHLLLGDPAPGRSALDQRRAGE